MRLPPSSQQKQWLVEKLLEFTSYDHPDPTPIDPVELLKGVTNIKELTDLISNSQENVSELAKWAAHNTIQYQLTQLPSGISQDERLDRTLHAILYSLDQYPEFNVIEIPYDEDIPFEEQTMPLFLGVKDRIWDAVTSAVRSRLHRVARDNPLIYVEDNEVVFQVGAHQVARWGWQDADRLGQKLRLAAEDARESLEGVGGLNENVEPSSSPSFYLGDPEVPLEEDKDFEEVLGEYPEDYTDPVEARELDGVDYEAEARAEANDSREDYDE